MLTLRYRSLWLSVLALALAACGESGTPEASTPSIVERPDDGVDVTAGETLRIEEAAILATPSAAGLDVRLPIERLTSGDADVDIAVAILRLDGTLAANGAIRATLRADAAVDGVNRVVVTVPFTELPEGTAEAGALADFVIAYDIQSTRTALSGRRSLYLSYPKTDVSVIAAAELNVDGPSSIRIVAGEAVSGMPLADTPVTVALQLDDRVEELFAGRTDAFGVLVAPIEADPSMLGAAELVIAVGEGATADVVRSPIRVTRSERVLLTTDKPVYQPGQRIHMRTLALSRPSLSPAADRTMLFEIYDAEGNKVYREEVLTDAYGVASLEVPLANELNQGNWRLAATLDDTTTERTVRVERYVLPNFGVSVATDRPYYGPGDTAIVDIDAQYFFGQPVSGGRVLVQPYTFDVGFNPLEAIETTLDDNGIARVSVTIPSTLVGQPLEQGNAFVRLDITVKDGAEQEETATRNLTVTDRDVLQSIIPASTLLAGTTNTLYVLTRSPVGGVVSAENTLRYNGDEITFETNELGFAEVMIDIPTDATSVALELRSEAADGRVADEPFTLALSGTGQAIGIVSDGSLYQVGDSAELVILADASVQRAFIDVIREGQTLLTDAIDLEAGRGDYTLDLSADLTGALQIHAYFITDTAQIVRGTRLLYVEDEGQLTIAYVADADEYRPGEDATVQVRVTDTEGQGVAAAVGLTIVDEAVFALQDMRPGFERVYFELEEELLEPQYNLYGWSMENVLAGGELGEVERETAASVVLAATAVPGFGSLTNTLTPARNASRSISRTWITQDAQRVGTWFIEQSEAGVFTNEDWNNAQRMQDIVDALPIFADAWGQPYRITLDLSSDMEPRAYGIRVVSAGLDEVFETDDDGSRTFSSYDITWQEWWGDFDSAEGGGGGFGPPQAGADAGMGVDDAFAPEPSPEEGEGNGGGSDAPRVRQFFPETLLVMPDIITDADGNFSMTFPVADSITTWRMTGMASTTTGQIGSGTGGLRVFQPFFVDIEFPVELTQNDEVGVPIALFNYLDTAQTVELSVDTEQSGDWFTPLSDLSVSVELAPGEVTVRYFTVRVDRVGTHPFQVSAIGTEFSDAVRRVVRVSPDGQEENVLVGGRLNGDVTVPVTIPVEAIDDASAIFVKLYPGLFAQVLEGLDSLLRVPSGCFEQTSSTTYPNVLALAYLQRTDQSSPEIELKATEYIAQGYQRLVSYEVAGGGFEWFGNDPAHPILTAYGLLQFHDMSQVFPVEPAVITRTQNWLLAQQQSDGRFRAASEGIHEGATNNFTDSDLRATAYLSYALIESGVEGPATDRALSWVRSELDGSITDPYTLGMAANMYLAADRSSADARALIDRLEALKQTATSEDGEEVTFWGSETQSLYYGSGDAMNMETTALILQAYIRSGLYPATVNTTVGWLVQNKDQFGNWSSTQATILTLRAFIELLASSVEEVNGTVRVFLGESLQQEFAITAETSDLMRLVDLSALTEEGTNEVRITIEGEGQMMYQVVGRYYLPWELVEAPPREQLAIEVSYDRTQLAIDETVEATVTLTNTTDARLDMIMLDLGIAPGFEVVMSDWNAAIEDPEIPVTRVERSGRQLTVYLYGLDGGETLTLSYRMRATLAIEAETPPSAAWLYYDPNVRTEREGEAFSVN